MSEPSETETAGYKRPPRKTQLKPGASGNPRCRPKRKQFDMSAILNNALNDKIVVTNLGTTQTRFKTLAQPIVDRSLHGDTNAIPELMKLFYKTKFFKLV